MCSKVCSFRSLPIVPIGNSTAHRFTRTNICIIMPTYGNTVRKVVNREPMCFLVFLPELHSGKLGYGF